MAVRKRLSGGHSLPRSARAIASAAALKLLEQEPAAAAGFGADPFVAWQQWLVARLEELTTALSFQRPELFQAQVRWARSALLARGIDLAHFRSGLVHLREALTDELPEQVRAGCGRLFRSRAGRLRSSAVRRSRRSPAAMKSSAG